MYQRDINRENREGSSGEVTEEFAAVVKALWSGQYKSVTPRDFKVRFHMSHNVYGIKGILDTGHTRYKTYEIQGMLDTGHTRYKTYEVQGL